MSRKIAWTRRTFVIEEQGLGALPEDPAARTANRARA